MAKALMIVPGASPEAIAKARARLAPPVSITMQGKPLADLPAFKTTVTAKRIVSEVLETHGVAPEEIWSKSRARRILDARQEAWARLYSETRLSLPQIAAKCGGYHHTTVLYAIRKMAGIATGKLITTQIARIAYTVEYRQLPLPLPQPAMPCLSTLARGKPDAGTIAEIEDRRARMGLSQRALAAIAGISQPAYANLVRGRFGARPWTFNRIRDVLMAA